MKSVESVLILGGPGGVGFMAVQIARAKEILVTATCGTRNIDFVKTLSAHGVIDSTRGNGEMRGEYDVVLEV